MYLRMWIIFPPSVVIVRHNIHVVKGFADPWNIICILNGTFALKRIQYYLKIKHCIWHHLILILTLKIKGIKDLAKVQQ